MSMLESPVRETAAEIRRRLFNPPGGRDSSELEIVSDDAARRMNLLRQEQEAAEALATRHHIALAEAIEITRQAKEAARAAAPRRAIVSQIIDVVCARYSIDKAVLVSPSRKANILLPRQISMYLCRTVGRKSFPEISRRHCRADHTTAWHAVGKIAAMVEKFPHFSAEIEDIKKSLVG